MKLDVFKGGGDLIAFGLGEGEDEEELSLGTFPGLFLFAGAVLGLKTSPLGK